MVALNPGDRKHHGNESENATRAIEERDASVGVVTQQQANEATTIEFSKDVTIEGKTLPAGKYGFFTIPNTNEWTIIFNKVPNQWGAFKYDAAQDALRITVKPKKSKAFNEKLWYTVNKNSVSLAWENAEVAFAVK